jgi:hypothetical protein
MIAGAHKSGTSSLKEYLGQHPQICTHSQREIAYFVVDRLYNQGYESIFDRYFNLGSDHQLILAKNVDVMYSKSTILRLKDHNPSIQIVVVLRNPVDRAYSAYWYARRTGWETIPTFEEAIKADPDRHGEDLIKKWGCAYLSRSEYIHHIMKLYEYFRADQIHVYLLEDLIDNPDYVCQSIFEIFSDITSDFSPDTSYRVNPATIPKNRQFANYVYASDQNHYLKRIVRSVIPGGYIDKVRDTIIKMNEKEFSPPPINPATRMQLYKYFKPFNQQLEEVLGRDLSHWVYI